MSTAKARVPTDEEFRWITTRAVAEIIPHEEFVKALRSGRRLRLKMGFDPSAPDLTLGHTVGLRKLRQLQELGHTVVIIVGDWTARIGDPSGQSRTRPMLTPEEVKANADTYLRQFFTIVDRELTEVRWQSEWFDEFTLAEVVRLAAKFTVSQMLQRDDFADRFAAKKPIGIHEFLYPLLQAYDSVAVEADVEFGGTDQKFNLLVGRELQADRGQPSQAVFLVPLLVGTDGKIKMSKSLGNYIAVDDPPHDMYGKLMSIPDALISAYFELLTDVPDEELAVIRASIEKHTTNPMEHKLRLARGIVEQFHGEEAGQAAAAEFERVFRKRESPEEMVDLPLNQLPRAKRSPSAEGAGVQLYDLGAALWRCGFAPSNSEARRLIKQGAVEINGGKISSNVISLESGMVIRVGKHRFLRIVDADSSHGRQRT